MTTAFNFPDLSLSPIRASRSTRTSTNSRRSEDTDASSFPSLQMHTWSDEEEEEEEHDEQQPRAETLRITLDYSVSDMDSRPAHEPRGRVSTASLDSTAPPPPKLLPDGPVNYPPLPDRGVGVRVLPSFLLDSSHEITSNASNGVPDSLSSRRSSRTDRDIFETPSSNVSAVSRVSRQSTHRRASRRPTLDHITEEGTNQWRSVAEAELTEDEEVEERGGAQERDMLESQPPPPSRSRLEDSSEQAFQNLHNKMHEVSISDSSPDTLSTLLVGVRVVVEPSCCAEAASDVRLRLRHMGAVLARTMSPSVTHVIFGAGGSKTVLREAMAMRPRPALLSPKWVHECHAKRRRLDEQAFSLYGGKHLIDCIRWASIHHEETSVEVVELSDDTHDASGHGWQSRAESLDELTFDQPMTATQMLAKIDILSKRLEDCAPDLLNHSMRCSSRCARVSHGHTNKPKTTTAATNTSRVKAARRSQKVLLRRSHAGFALAHRAPFSIAVEQQRRNKDVVDALPEYEEEDENQLSAEMRRLAVHRVNGIDDGRRTARTDLNDIRQTLRNNVSFARRGGRALSPRKAPGKISAFSTRILSQKPATQRKVVRIDNDGEEEEEEEAEARRMRTPSPNSNRVPLVETRSALLNRLTAPSSDEFVCEREARRPKRKEKSAIVLTGVGKREERALSALAASLKLQVHPRVSSGARCVVSTHGRRTLNVLRAVVNRIPVVNAQWLDDSASEGRLLATRKYEFEDWRRVIEARGSGPCRLLSPLGPILVLEGVTPPADDLRSLISKSGGRVTSSILECTVVIAPQSTSIHLPLSGRTMPPPPVVIDKYILDCITRNEVLLYNSYYHEDYESD